MTTLHAERFAPLDEAIAGRWSKFPHGLGRVYFPGLVGLQLEEVRTADGTLTYTIRPPR